MKPIITLKQLVVLLISSIGLYFTGKNLQTMIVEMASINSFLDVLNVMIFFTCFFPFLILLARLSREIIKGFISFLKFALHSVQAAIF